MPSFLPTRVHEDPEDIANLEEAALTNTLGKFDFRVFGGKKDAALGPCVVLILQRWDDLQGSPAISPHLAAGEIDIYIAQLKADLDEVARKAKTTLARAN